MQDNDNNNKITMWFNSKLFYKNEEPLKFYVEGCKEVDFHQTVKIIEAYGGKVSEPDGDTLIFISNDADRSSENRHYYDVKYLRDCIAKGRILDLEKYKLPLMPSDRRSDRKNGESVTHSKQVPEDVRSQNNVTDEIKEEDAEGLSGRKRHSESMEEDELSSARTREFTGTTKRPKKVEEEKGELKEEVPACANGAIDDDEGSSSSHRPGKEKFGLKMKGQRKFTEEESGKIIRYLIDKKGISRVGGLNVWKEMIEDLKMFHRTPQILRAYYQEYLRYTYKKYTDDVEAQEEIARSFDQITKSTRNYSDKENRQIMQYLIRENLISRVRDEEIWRELKKNCPLNGRSINSLKAHFWRNLINKYENYTKNEEASKEFRKILKQKNKRIESAKTKPKRAYHRWTAEDDELIMNYLIDNDVIDQARYVATYKRMIREIKFGHEPTAHALLVHFKRYLQVRYADFTEDPDVMLKFAALAAPDDNSNES